MVEYPAHREAGHAHHIGRAQHGERREREVKIARQTKDDRGEPKYGHSCEHPRTRVSDEGARLHRTEAIGERLCCHPIVRPPRGPSVERTAIRLLPGARRACLIRLGPGVVRI